MELRKKVARLVMSSISNRPGDDLAAQFHRLRREVLELGVGGYTIFGGNVDSTAEMVTELAEESGRSLLISSDLERGLGQQLEGGTVFPTQMAIGAAGVQDLAFAQGWATAREALAAGIDLVFSPVADVASEPENPIIGIRAFGGDPEEVAGMTAAFVRGCQQAGAAATAKHFPGHGDTSLDSHIELPTVRADRSLLESRELVPFRAAIAAGVRAVMTAHVAYPALTGDDTPATLSPVIVDRLLREELGFEGVIVTDALLMGAISERHGPAEAGVLALEAGADILLMPADIEATIDGLRAALAAGRISEERVDHSLERLEALHRWLGDYKEIADNHFEFPPEISGAFDCLEPPHNNHRVEGCGDWQPLGLRIARAALTLLADEEGVLPLAVSELDGSDVAAFALRDSDRAVNLVWYRSQLEARIEGVEVVVVDEHVSEPEVAAHETRAAGAAVTIIAVFDDVVAWKGRAGPSGELMSVAGRLMGAARRAVVIVFAGPETAVLVPEGPSLVCCYDGSMASQYAAVEALFGERSITGRLPVAVPPRFERGAGIPRDARPS